MEGRLREKKVEGETKPTRYYSDKQEKQVASRLRGKQTANSGATKFSKGDVLLEDFLVECKTKTKDSESFTIHKEWIDKHQQMSIKRMEREYVENADIEKLKLDAKVYFSREIERFSKMMGIKYGRMKITSARKRFGSCSSKGNICFSYRLMLYPERAREYVVVHELAHIIEMNHSTKFYHIIEKVMPDYKERKKLLM